MVTIILNLGFGRMGLKLKARFCATSLFLLLAPALLSAADLKPETLRAWDAYVHAAKIRVEARTRGDAPFLWVDEEHGPAQRVRAGEVVVEPEGGGSPHSVPSGLIHDWVGTVFVPGARLEDVVRVLDDYERYSDFYKPMVAKASLLELTRGHEKITLLMTLRAFSVTAAVETDNEVAIVKLSSDKAYSLSTSIRVQEISNYGKPGEHALPENHGPGYVWRTFTVTRLEQRDGGVYTEIEMIAMSRRIAAVFRWLFQPLAEQLPRKVLVAMLEDTRAAVVQETQTTSLRAQARPR